LFPKAQPAQTNLDPETEQQSHQNTGANKRRNLVQKFRQEFWDHDTGAGSEHQPRVKAPVIGMSILAASYGAAALAAGAFTLKNRRDNPEVLKKFYTYETAYHAMHWVLPSLLLPTIRYTMDPEDKRDELYIRDFTHAWLGAVVYWSAKKGAQKLLDQYSVIGLPALKEKLTPEKAKRVQQDAVKLASATVATLTQVANNGFLAPKLSHLFTHVTAPKPEPAQADHQGTSQT
jgi:hypothetical protein